MGVDEAGDDDFPLSGNPALGLNRRGDLFSLADRRDSASGDGDGAIGEDPPLGVHRDDGCALNQQIGGFRRGRHEASRVECFIPVRYIVFNSTTRSRKKVVGESRQEFHTL